MSAWELPRNLVRAVDGESADSAKRRWTIALPEIVDELSRHWSLDVGPPLQPGGSASWVAGARGADGQRVVLKVGWRHHEALNEADGLRAWDGRGVVRLLDARAFGQTSALLLEACEPGTPLGDVMPEHEQDVVVAKLLPRLWVAPPAEHAFHTLQSMCDAWADEFDARRAATGSSAIARDQGLERAGIELLRELPRSAAQHVLLCTDLHAGNVLAAQREPWLVIDPKPHVGDPTYDALQHMLNCDRLTADPSGFARRMAGLLDLDPQRLLAWLFARCVQESFEDPALRRVAIALAP